jgi:hypothetical protein
MATPGYPKPLSLENHIRIIALIHDLQRISFYCITEILNHNFTTKLILFLILTGGSYPSSKIFLLCRKLSIALWLLWHANLYKIATRVGTSNQSE